MNQINQFRITLMAGLVADAAALCLHLLYDVKRIAEVSKAHNNQPAYIPIDVKHYTGEVGYFAHGHKHSGMLTHYGESLRLMINSMNDCQGEFNMASVQQHF